ncbi:MAG TPA: ABC transporter permease [Candidatus Obscuribacterales bacterium]
MTTSLDMDIVESQRVANQGTNQLPKMTSTNEKILRRFMRHRLALFGLIILVVLYGSALFADVLSPYGMNSAEISQSHFPPSQVHMMHQGNFKGPFIYHVRKRLMIGETGIPSSKQVVDKKIMYPVQFFVKGEPYKFMGLIPMELHLFGVGSAVTAEGQPATLREDEKPNRFYIWGADIQGRDLFTRLLFGARISLTVGILAICISYPLGLLMGGIAGYFGGWIDNLIMRVVEAIISFPSLYLLLTLSATLPKGLTSIQRYLAVIVILAFIGWAGQARIYRGQVLSLRQLEYVEAARSVGMKDIPIIIRHIIPQMASWIIVSATISIPAYTLGEAALSFLGLGIQDPESSWGLMLSEAKNVVAVQQSPWLLIPGFAIVLTVFGFNFFGDGLRDAFDTKKTI